MFSEDPILLPEIVDQIVLVTVHPASEHEDEELQRRRHSLRLLGRLDQHRPSLGRFFAPYALAEALAQYGPPAIFNTDQGSQFTSLEFTQTLKDAGVQISMDGKGRWMDNVFIERLWRSLKYECVYLHDFEVGSEARASIGRWNRLLQCRATALVAR